MSSSKAVLPGNDTVAQVFKALETETTALLEPLDLSFLTDYPVFAPDSRGRTRTLEVAVEIVSPRDWPHGSAKGICQYRPQEQPRVAVSDRENNANLAVTLVHEYAHALLHSGVNDEAERSKRELEAESVGYTVGRYFELDTSGSAFYLAAWEGDEPETILDRLERISSTAQEIIDIVSEEVDDE